MLRSYNLNAPPERFISYLAKFAEPEGVRFRRRAVLTQTDKAEWRLVCCGVEGIPSVSKDITKTSSQHYDHAVLYEDWLTADECRDFVEQAQRGRVLFGDIALERDGNAYWELELVPLNNMSMARAGLVVQTQFAPNVNQMSRGPLLAKGAPYFPDLSEAARHWLPLNIYHGDSDARNGRIIFLLPELRSFFVAAKYEKEILTLHIEGTEADSAALVVKGAYWVDKAYTSFEEPVRKGEAKISVPAASERLEYLLLDEKSDIRDFQCEDRLNHSGLGKGHLAGSSEDLGQQVRAACLEGEGQEVEFKPFIDCTAGMGSGTKKTKFRELVTTVVAFANTKGGRIYMGVNDECCISGVNQGLQQWAEANVTDETAERYRGALTAKLRDQIIGDVSIRVSYVFVEEFLIVIVDVSQSPAKPASIRQNNILYVRAGASNKQLPPDQWSAVLTPSNHAGNFPFRAM